MVFKEHSSKQSKKQQKPAVTAEVVRRATGPATPTNHSHPRDGIRLTRPVHHREASGCTLTVEATCSHPS